MVSREGGVPTWRLLRPSSASSSGVTPIWSQVGRAGHAGARASTSETGGATLRTFPSESPEGDGSGIGPLLHSPTPPARRVQVLVRRGMITALRSAPRYRAQPSSPLQPV